MARRLVRATAVVAVSALGSAAVACSFIYGLHDNLGPLDGGRDGPGDSATFAPDASAADAALDAPPDTPRGTHWCTTQEAGPHTFCEDFDESDSSTPDGFSVQCGKPMLTVDGASCYSPPNCLAADNGGCVAIRRTLATQTGLSSATVNLWYHIDVHDAAALNKVTALDLNVAGGTTYTVGVTVQSHMNFFYVATDGTASFIPVLAASVPGDFQISFTIDVVSKTLTGKINGTPAQLSLGTPIPMAAQVQSVSLIVGIPSSTAGSGETVHVDDITLDLN